MNQSKQESSEKTSCSYRRKLPAELNREIYLSFNTSTQRKFICGLGWDFYSMFRQKLLKKVFFAIYDI
jgi:hypothetical protein